MLFLSAKREQLAFKVAIEEAKDPDLKQVMQESLNYSNSLLKDKQAKMRDFIKQTGQDRNYFREQNHQKENSLTSNSTRGIINNRSNILFNSANNINQAKEYAANILGFSVTEYDAFNVDVANMVNLEISKIYNIFGDLYKSGYFEGIIYYQKDSDFIAAYSKSHKVILMKNVSSADSIYRMEKEAQEQFKFGFWSDDSKEHIIRHETGHAIQHWLTDNSAEKLKKISNIRIQIMQECNINEWSISDTKENMKKA